MNTKDRWLTLKMTSEAKLATAETRASRARRWRSNKRAPASLHYTSSLNNHIATCENLCSEITSHCKTLKTRGIGALLPAQRHYLNGAARPARSSLAPYTR